MLNLFGILPLGVGCMSELQSNGGQQCPLMCHVASFLAEIVIPLEIFFSAHSDSSHGRCSPIDIVLEDTMPLHVEPDTWDLTAKIECFPRVCHGVVQYDFVYERRLPQIQC